VPSFTDHLEPLAHLGCPVQANGPSGSDPGMKDVIEQTEERQGHAQPDRPAGFGCPCQAASTTPKHRTAGPPVRALDRYRLRDQDGRVVLLSTYSVSHVENTGAQAKIHKYKLVGPGSKSTASSRCSIPSTRRTLMRRADSEQSLSLRRKQAMAAACTRSTGSRSGRSRRRHALLPLP